MGWREGGEGKREEGKQRERVIFTDFIFAKIAKLISLLKVPHSSL